MSRSMERAQVFGLASGAAQTVLTCPADHKYEVLELELFIGNPGAAETLCYYLDTTANLRLFEWHKPPAFNRQDRFIFPGLVLYATEVLKPWVISTGVALTYQAFVSYIDVDYTT